MTLVDEFRGLAGKSVAFEDTPADLYRAVRVNATFYSFVGWTDHAGVDLMWTLVVIADRTLRISSLKVAPDPDIGYENEGLFDLLPRTRQLTGPLVWNLDLGNCDAECRSRQQQARASWLATR